MNIFKLLFELFIIYLLYKMVFDFIIPVYRTTKQMKQKINEMNHRMNKQQETSQQPVHPAGKPAPNKDFSKDYIDYEEVR